MSIMYGWYSNKMKKHNRDSSINYYSSKSISYIYLTTDDKEVEVTVVSDNNEDYGGVNIKTFPDLVYVGELKGWVRTIYN